MTHHLTDEQFIGYIHHTLTDAEREAIDRHLADCLTCRASLDEHEALQRHIRNNLSADLHQSHPSAQMSFAAFAPHLKRKRRLSMIINKSNQLVYGAATLVILLVLGVGLVMFLRGINQPDIVTSTTPSPIEVIEALEAAHNAQDVDAIVALYAEDGVEKNGAGTFAGPEGIRRLYNVAVEDFKIDNTNIRVEGDTVFYDALLIRNEWNVRGEKYEAVVENGRIKSNFIVGTFNPADIEDPQPTEIKTVAMFRGDPQRTGVYNDTTDPPMGELLWKFETGDNVLSSPTVNDGVVYFGSNDQHLYALDGQTGQELWRLDAGGWVLSPPAVIDGVVYVGSGCAGDMICIDGANQKNQLLALDSKNGQEIWRFPAEMGVSSSPAIVDRTVYFGSYDGHLYAVNSQTGQEIWRFKADNSIISSPAVVGDFLYFGSGCFQCTLFSEEKDGDFLYAVDRHTGEELWRFKTDGYVESTPAVVDGVVYFGSNDRHLYAVDSQSGQVKWQLKTFGRITTSPAVTADRVYITSHDRSLYAIDRQTGQEIWHFTTDWPLSSSPIVVAGVVYFGGSGSDGPLYAVDSQTGQEIWTFKVDEPIYSSPTIANGVVYIGSEDNYLYAVR